MSALDYPFEPRDFGVPVPVAQGVEWIRLPLPFRPGHVNVYRLAGDDAPFVVDGGLADAETTRCWEAQGEAPRRLLVTHFHPDHIGQAARLESGGATVHVPAPELAHARGLHELPGERLQATLAAFFKANGVALPPEGFGLGNGYRRSVPELPREAEPLQRGALPFAGEWTISFASGHSPAHALVFRAGPPTLAAGDILLPEISPNISVWPDAPEADPLGDYLQALRELRELPEDTLVLPAHGRPYRGLRRRVDMLVAHHDKRLDILRSAVIGQAVAAADVIPRLFRPGLKSSSIPFALGEALAHLNRLWHAGELERGRDDDGVWRYTER